MTDLPTPALDNLLWLFFGILLGLPAPYWYAQERIRGFVRFGMKKLPYEPPPGKNEDEAMEDASMDGE